MGEPGPGGTPGRYLEQPPLALAHRGGVGLPANEGIENTVQAVRNAVELGYRYIETDARASSDGVAFSFHDEHFGRVAPDSGFGQTPFGDLTADQITSVKLAGGEPVATIAELLAAFPEAKFNIDVKTTEVIEPTLRAVRESGALDRVLIASFSYGRIRRVRRLLPGVATSATPPELVSLRVLPALLGWFATLGGAVCCQVPERQYGIHITTPGFLRAAHRRGLQVHIWTVDEPADINRLLDGGVDGIITDRPDALKDVLIERGRWREA